MIIRDIIFGSLRGRYASVAVALAVMVLAGALFAHQVLSRAGQVTADNLASRHQLQQHSRLIRSAVWETSDALEGFLLDPGHPGHRQRVHSTILQAIHQVDTLIGQGWNTSLDYRPIMHELRARLLALDEATRELITIRLDSSLQYPSLGYARDHMLPMHIRFYTAASLALEELREQQGPVQTDIVFISIVEARHHWTQIISNFRMYLMNRIGSFQEQGLGIQENEIKLQLAVLLQHLHYLRQLDEQDALGFQTSVSSRDMLDSALQWAAAFEKILEIHQTTGWRQDTLVLATRVRPIIEHTWNLLQNFDLAIERSANEDIHHLADTAKTLTRTLWLLAMLGLLSIYVGYIVFQRAVLEPVAGMARALHAEASGKEVIALPHAGTVETRNLVEAFGEMRNQVHHRQKALEFQAMHDMLTGLCNRNLFIDRARQALILARRLHASVAVLMIDLDRFKDINDTLGHQVGDQVLVDVSKRLALTLRHADTVARLGGDEFAVLLLDTDEDKAGIVARSILATFTENLRVGNCPLHVNASIGIAVYPQHGEDTEALMRHADVAMYLAKHQKLGFSLYDPEQDRHSIGMLALGGDLHEALQNDGLDLCYQPKIELHSGEVQGVEALLRWHHPRHGFVSPIEIIPLAEQGGMIHELTLWVLERALRQQQAWHAQGMELSVAVNLSAYNLQNSECIGRLHNLLEKIDFPPQRLTLEITESVMMMDPHQALAMLNRLHAMGVELAIDDYGTGFSSLAYIKQLPVCELKIDKSFVMDMCQDENDAVIVRSTIDLAHNLGLRVVAEGVEDQQTSELLQALGCDAAQGYHIARPMPAERFGDWLRDYQASGLATRRVRKSLMRPSSD